MKITSTITTTVHDNKYLDLWEKYFLPIGLPLLIGLALGPFLAFLIVNEAWLFVLAIPFLVPVAIVLVRYPFAAVFIWLMVLPFFPPTMKTRYLYWIFHRALIPGTLGITILARMFKLKKFRPLRLGWPELAMLMYLAAGVISILLTRSRPLKMIYVLYERTFVPFTAYWFMRSISPDEKDLRRLLIPFMLVLFLAESVIGLVSWFSPQSLPRMWLERNAVGARTTGTFTQVDAYTSTMMWLLLFLLHYTMAHTKGAKRVLLLLLFGLGLVCVFFSFSRASWLASLLVMLGLLCIYPKPVGSLILAILPLMVILSTSVLANEVAFAYERLTGEASKHSAERRLIYIEAGQKMFLARPLLGWGYGNYDLYDWKFMERVGNVAPTRWDVRHGTTHNTYLTMLAETGAIGFLLYAFPIAWWLGRTIKALPRLPKRGFWSQRLLITMWLAVGFYILVAQAVDMRFFWFSHTVPWLTLGLIADMVVQTDLKRLKWARPDN
jgi:O-antigen ligase